MPKGTVLQPIDIIKDFQKSKDALSKIIGEPKTSKEKTEIQDVDA